jgi:hypothetical protein
MSRWHRVRVMKQDVHGGDGGASRRSSAPSVARVVGGVCGGEPRTTSRGPHLLYIALYDGGATNYGSVGHPRPGREVKPDSAFGPGRCGDRTNTRQTRRSHIFSHARRARQTS